MKKAIIIHGWDGYPEEGWFPWLKVQLGAMGYRVIVPLMPESAVPKIPLWVGKLQELASDVDEETLLIGHSMGCQTILRYLESLPEGKRIGKAILVAGFFTLTGLESDEEKEITKPWLETPIDFEKVKTHVKQIIALFSDNDPFVPSDNHQAFKNKLGARVIVAHEKGHYSGSDGTTELPQILPFI